MYKDKEKQRESSKERMRRHRERKGVTNTSWAKSVMLESEGVTVAKSVTPDILDKLTDPKWRTHLEKVCSSFKASSNPSYSKDVWLGNTNLSTVCEWLECTN